MLNKNVKEYWWGNPYQPGDILFYFDSFSKIKLIGVILVNKIIQVSSVWTPTLITASFAVAKTGGILDSCPWHFRKCLL